jgi:hypothetical protein
MEAHQKKRRSCHTAFAVYATVETGQGLLLGPLVPRGPHGLRLFRNPPPVCSAHVEHRNYEVTIEHAGRLVTGRAIWIGWLSQPR